MPKGKKSTPSFSKQFSQLEEIVDQLQDDVDIDEAMKLFEKGMKLAETLQISLEKKEQQIIEIKERYTNE